MIITSKIAVRYTTGSQMVATTTWRLFGIRLITLEKTL